MHYAKKRFKTELPVNPFPSPAPPPDVKMLISFSLFFCVALSQNIDEILYAKIELEKEIETCFRCGEALNIVILVNHP